MSPSRGLVGDDNMSREGRARETIAMARETCEEETRPPWTARAKFATP